MWGEENFGEFYPLPWRKNTSICEGAIQLKIRRHWVLLWSMRGRRTLVRPDMKIPLRSEHMDYSLIEAHIPTQKSQSKNMSFLFDKFGLSSGWGKFGKPSNVIPKDLLTSVTSTTLGNLIPL